MALSDEKLKEYVGRLLLSRMRILSNHGFFGLLLMHMKFAVDETVETACTDGNRIIFGTDFLDDLSEKELDFVMMHEIMHVALRHCFRYGDRNSFAFNVACDIVVNSNILYENDMDLSSITLKKYGESMHTTPDKKEGYEYTAEEVYSLLPASMKKKKAGDDENGAGGWDDHSMWDEGGMSEADRALWEQRIKEAAEAIEIREASSGRSFMPLMAKRFLKELRRAQTDWRTILNEFVQEDVSDYSFSPPDRRFDGGDFFLPDFNEKDYEVRDILFMVDTSGSISDEMIGAAYSEISGAIEQFGGKLCGWLGFFDAVAVPPKPFSSEEELKIIRPLGGGGTDFMAVFDCAKRMNTPPASIVILTDGYAPFPSEKEANGIPVLWLINNETVLPPWGKVTRIEI